MKIDGIIKLVKEHSQTWRDRPETYWFARFVEEVGNLGCSIFGEHWSERAADEVLARIASICINWLDMRQNRRETEQQFTFIVTGVKRKETPWTASCQISVDEQD